MWMTKTWCFTDHITMLSTQTLSGLLGLGWNLGYSVKFQTIQLKFTQKHERLMFRSWWVILFMSKPLLYEKKLKGCPPSLSHPERANYIRTSLYESKWAFIWQSQFDSEGDTSRLIFIWTGLIIKQAASFFLLYEALFGKWRREYQNQYWYTNSSVWVF